MEKASSAPPPASQPLNPEQGKKPASYLQKIADKNSTVEDELRKADEDRLRRVFFTERPEHVLSDVPIIKDIVAPISYVTKGIDKVVPEPVKILAEEALFTAMPAGRLIWRGINFLF